MIATQRQYIESINETLEILKLNDQAFIRIAEKTMDYFQIICFALNCCFAAILSLTVLVLIVCFNCRPQKARRHE